MLGVLFHTEAPPLRTAPLRLARGLDDRANAQPRRRGLLLDKNATVIVARVVESRHSRVPSPSFPGILLSRKSPDAQGKRQSVFEKSDG